MWKNNMLGKIYKHTVEIISFALQFIGMGALVLGFSIRELVNFQMIICLTIAGLLAALVILFLNVFIRHGTGMWN